MRDADGDALRAAARSAGARRLRREAFAELGHRTRRSWTYAAPGFERGMECIASGKAVPERGEFIWGSKLSRVWKMALERDCGGDVVVYKELPANRRIRYLFAPTPTAREAAHYIMLKRLGFPVADLLAAGDVRSGRRLEKSFIVTRFAEGYQDGRPFAAGGARRNDGELRGAFIGGCLELLALFHRIHVFHKGFKAYNVLWREVGPSGDLPEDRESPRRTGKEAERVPGQIPGPVRLRLIDFASCRFRPSTTFAMHVVEDLAIFFVSLNLSLSELDPYLTAYRARNPGCGMGEAVLRRRVTARMARLAGS